jgi:hypothetical protein
MNKQFLEQLYFEKFTFQNKLKELQAATNNPYNSETADFDIAMDDAKIQLQQANIEFVQSLIDQYIKTHTK